MKCRYCEKTFTTSRTQPLFMACDAIVCSATCSAKRIKSIIRIDPKLDNSISWVIDKNLTDSSIPLSTDDPLSMDVPLPTKREIYASEPVLNNQLLLLTIAKHIISRICIICLE